MLNRKSPEEDRYQKQIEEDYNKIPKEYIEFLENNYNASCEFEYDKSKTFDEQELLEDTKYILFGLFEKGEIGDGSLFQFL